MPPQPQPALRTPRLNEFARLTGVIFDPKPAFADIAARPRWAVPLALLTVLSLLYVHMFSQRVGWERFMRHTMETEPRAQSLTAEQREQISVRQARFASAVGYVGAAVGPAGYALVVSAVLLLVFGTLLSADVRSQQVFAVTCYASLTGVFATALAILMLFLKHPDDFDLRNPTAFNIGAYLDPLATRKWLYSLAASIDLFTLWTILLLALGMSAAARRMSFRSCLVWIGALWAVWVALKCGWAAVFS